MRRNRSTTGQLVRRLTLGAGPLKRGSDRLELLARVLLVCCLLAAVPISVGAGTTARVQATSTAAAEAADRHRVTAVLVAEATARVGDIGVGSPWTPWTAEWTGPDGADHQGTVSVRSGAEAGSTVPIWVDGHGDRRLPPMNPQDVTDRAVGRGVGVFVALSAISVGALVLVRRLLDRSRSRRWAAEWARVGPTWSRSVS